MDALVIGSWKIGYDRPNKKAVLVLEFSDRAPLALAIDPAEAPKIGRALCELNTQGYPTPLRLS